MYDACDVCRYMIIFNKEDLLRGPEEQDGVCSRKKQKFHL